MSVTDARDPMRLKQASRTAAAAAVMALLGLGSMAAPAVTAQIETPSQPQPTAPLTAATVRVNGRSIPVCSHGQLCQGAFLRAISNRP